MKTLQDVAKQYKKSVGQAIYPGVPYNYGKGKTPTSSRAFKTGNLLTKFVQSSQNQPNTIGKKTKDGFEFEVEVAPKGAEYGKYVHYGTYKMRARPFGELGFNEPNFVEALDEFLQEQTDDFAQTTLDGFDSMFRKSGFKIT